jgi:colicin import membrane protein
VRLQPLQTETALSSTSLPTLLPVAASPPTTPPLLEQPKSEFIPSLPPKEDILPQPEIAIPDEIPAVQEIISPPVPATPSPSVAPPLPTKNEVKSAPKAPSPKPALQETPKPPAKSAAPIKKPIESTAKKATQTEKVKSQQAEEAEKKRQQEQAEKKRQEQAEKKKQQEKAEAERKRQQEIAAAQEVARQKEQALLTKAKENLAKMSQTRDKISSSSSINLETTTPLKELGSLQVDALLIENTEGTNDWGAKEVSYSDEIAYLLKTMLKLPDYGAIKIKLTLNRTGRAIKVETLQSESTQNKVYVENKIQKMSFPSFGQRFQGVSQNTFIITLQNDS